MQVLVDRKAHQVVEDDDSVNSQAMEKPSFSI